MLIALAALRVALALQATPDAARDLLPALTSALTRRGYQVVGVAEQPDIVLRVTAGFALPERARPKGPPAAPAIGLEADAHLAGGAVWRNSFAFVGAPPKQKSLATLAVAKLLWSFPAAPGAALTAEDDAALPPAAVAASPVVPDYDAPIDRLRSARKGPRFPLRMRRRCDVWHVPCSKEAP
jgi:hypothetical protein